MRGCILIFLGLFTIFSSYCQNINPDSSFTLDPVVISATYTPAHSSKTGRNITIIRGEQLTNLPVNSVDELLRYLPGVEIQSRGPMGVQGDISIRGSTFQQVLVVLDGVRLNDPLTGHFSSYIPLPASEIERVEILKGASSAIYGTEAVGGVVHIITKTFARTTTESGMDVQLTGGEFGLWGINGGGQWANDHTIISAGILSNHALGQPQRGTTGFFDLTSISLGFNQRFSNNWSLGLRTSYDNRNFSAQNFYTTFLSDTSKEKVTSWWQSARLSYSKKNLSWTTEAGLKWLRDQFAFNSMMSPNNNKTQLYQVLSKANVTLNENTMITGGIQYISRGIESNDRGNHQVRQTALFGILHLRPAAGWQIDPAIRFDWHERAGFEFVPQLNLSYKLNQWQLRGSAGRTIRDADFTERFNNYNRERVVAGRIGNPDLVAESAWNYEFGADYWPGMHWKFSTTLFFRDQVKLIDWIRTPYADMPRKDNLVPGGNYALAKNIWQVKTNGFEVDIQHTKHWGNKQSLLMQAGFLWIQNNGNENTPSLYLSAQARFLTNFNVLYQYHKWSFSVTGLYKQREEQKTTGGIQAQLSPEYFLLNTKIEFSPVKKFSIFAQVDNVGNINYSDILGAQMPRRWWMGGIRWKR